MTLAADHIVQDEVDLGRLRCIELPESTALRVFSLHTRANSEPGNLGRLFCKLAATLAPDFDRRTNPSLPGN